MSSTMTVTSTEASSSSSSGTLKVGGSNEKGYAIHEQGAENISIGGVPFPIPKFSNPYEKRQWMLEHLAGTFRIFARKDYSEGAAGHITIRDPVDPQTFWINPLGMHFGQITASDLVHVDAQGNIIGGSKKPINAAGFRIHAAIYRARPDVESAAHAHSIYGKAYSSFGKPLEMINQDVCNLYNCHSVYTDFGGLVLEDEEGDKIAASLGKNKAVILTNHGLLTVGSTVDEAGYLFSLMERSCQAQLLVDAARRQGRDVVPISDQEAFYTWQHTSDPASLFQEAQSDYEYEKYLTKGEFLK